MIVKNLRKRNLQLMTAFSSAKQHEEHHKDLRHKFHDEITDEDYRRFDTFNQQPPSREPKWNTLYNFFSKLPNFPAQLVFQFFSGNFESSQATQQSDYFNPPKVHDNSIFIYQSRELANTARTARATELFFLAVGTGFFTYPLYAAAFAVPYYFVWANAWFYEMSRRLVTRMDLLPHLEMIHVQRIGLFGCLYSKLYRVQDLQYVSYQSVQEKENYFWAASGPVLDRHLIFKCKNTGDLLLFDRYGCWDYDGLNHKLLN